VSTKIKSSLAVIYAGGVHCTACAAKDLPERPDMGRIYVTTTEPWWSPYQSHTQKLECVGCFAVIDTKTLGRNAEWNEDAEEYEPECEHDNGFEVRHGYEYCNDCDAELGESCSHEYTSERHYSWEPNHTLIECNNCGEIIDRVRNTEPA
jgi:hypothetical protein